jgi:UDP-N-acetylmuramoyl-L-alanyl-D-glutamate--2,6-diaminopimelate ligase
MDYHPTVEHYLATKLRLFSEIVAPGGAAVVAADHPHAARVIEVAQARGLRLFTVGREGADIRLVSAAIDGFAQRLVLAYDGKTHHLRLPLVGDFQIENALVASGLVIVTGGDSDKALAALEYLDGVPGRLEYVGVRHGAPVFVDYAHKPDALAKALAALRPYTRRRLVVVFGAGGDRDPGKRPLMGAIAAEHADTVIVTDDNPRSEDAGAIRAAILAAAPAAREIGDRLEAIRVAVDSLQDGDVLLIAGKGHETGQIVGERVLPFDDREAARAALAMGQA